MIGVLEHSRINFTEFRVLGFFQNFHNPLFLRIGLAQFCRAFYFCFKTWLKVSVPISVLILFSCESRAFSFLVDPVPFLFLFCLCYYDSSALDSCCEGLGVGCLFSLDLSNVYGCGPVYIHTDA